MTYSLSHPALGFWIWCCYSTFRFAGIEPECDIRITGAGAYEYYVEHSPFLQDGADVWSRSKTGFFVVDPQLKLKKPDGSSGAISLPLEGLVIESVVPKWMGKLSEWTPHLETISKSGYNMLHFVPLQYRGISNSPYSIYDQLKFDPHLFEEEDLQKSEEEQRAIVKNKVAEIETKYGALSLTDIVWNHTACNSTWLWDHPESGTCELSSHPISLHRSLDSYSMIHDTPNKALFCQHDNSAISRLQPSQLSSPDSCVRTRQCDFAVLSKDCRSLESTSTEYYNGKGAYGCHGRVP